MKFKIPKAYDWLMDRVAMVLFPPPIKVYGKITLVEVVLAGYFLALGVGFSIWFGSWLWLAATALCAVFAWIWWGWKL